MTDETLIRACVATQNRSLLAAIDRIEALAATPSVPDRHEMVGRKCQFMADLLSHLAYMQERIVAPLLTDRRPEAQRAAQRAIRDSAGLLDQIARATRGWTSDYTDAEWRNYAETIRLLTRRIRVHLQGEERHILAYLPFQPGTGAVAAPPVSIDLRRAASRARTILFEFMRGEGTRARA